VADPKHTNAIGLVSSPGDILRAAARVLDVAERERLERLATPRKPSDAEVAQWAERHDLRGSAMDLRCAFEDAQTVHLTPGVPGTHNDQQEGGNA
jgi:hypothetical protein